MRELYEELLKSHGPQGWWPLMDAKGECAYRTDDCAPIDGQGRFEISVGAILTQNTNWTNVVQALKRMREKGLWSWESIEEADEQELQETIRPAGYYRQKTRKLKIAAKYLMSTKTPTREGLLDIWGIGPETADSILLYAYDEPVMVVDAYLRRVLKQRGHPQHDMRYDDLRSWIENQLPKQPSVLNEFHALIVAEGKSLKGTPRRKKA